MKLLIAEDDPKLLKTLIHIFESNKFSVDGVSNGEAALAYGRTMEYDGLIMDIMMPGMDGLRVLQTLRGEGITTPVLFLTARTEVSQRVEGLDSGADDYLTKPFAIEELLARMRVAFKHAHAGGAKKVILEVQGLEIDTDKRMVTVNGTVVDLTKKEYELLLYLVQNKNIVLSREQILNEVWGYSYIGETNVVDVYIRYLRSKIDEAFGIKYIHTIRGVGYYVKDE